MNSSSNERSFIDGIIQFKPGKFVVDRDLLEGALKQYETEQRPILDNRGVMRANALKSLAESEALVQEARAYRYSDMRSLVSIEKMGVKFPLTKSDRFVGEMTPEEFKGLMAKTQIKQYESRDLGAKLEDILSRESFYRAYWSGPTMPTGRLFTPFERQRTESNVAEIPRSIMWRQMNSLDGNFRYPEEEGRREAISSLAFARSKYEQNVLDAFSRFRGEVSGKLRPDLAEAMNRLEQQLDIRAQSYTGFSKIAHIIASKEIYRPNGPSWEEKPQATAIF